MYIEDKQLVKLFAEKEKELKKGRALEKKKRKIEEEQRKIGLKLNRYKEQMIPIVEKHKEKLDLGEFVEIEKIDVVKGKVKLTTIDIIEEYKKLIRDQRETNNKKDETKTKGTNKTTGETGKR